MKEALQKALETLRNKGTILYPTDTVWGLGCDARFPEAVEKIIKLKKRDAGKSFIILLDDVNKLQRYVKEVPEIAWDLIEFTENPLTIIFPAGINLAKNALNEDGSIAIRIVKQGFAHELIKKFGHPIISTSANLSGGKSPAYFNEIEEDVLTGVDYVVNLTEQGTGKPSTILKLGLGGEFTFLRK